MIRALDGIDARIAQAPLASDLILITGPVGERQERRARAALRRAAGGERHRARSDARGELASRRRARPRRAHRGAARRRHARGVRAGALRRHHARPRWRSRSSPTARSRAASRPTSSGSNPKRSRKSSNAPPRRCSPPIGRSISAPTSIPRSAACARPTGSPRPCCGLIVKLRDAGISPETMLAQALRGAATFYGKPPNFAEPGLAARDQRRVPQFAAGRARRNSTASAGARSISRRSSRSSTARTSTNSCATAASRPATRWPKRRACSANSPRSPRRTASGWPSPSSTTRTICAAAKCACCRRSSVRNCAA